MQKNLYLFKLVSKYKRVIRKWHKRLQVFDFCDLKLIPTDSALNSALGNLTKIFQNYRCGTKKTVKFENLSYYRDLLPQNWKVLEPNHFTESRPGIVWVKKDMSNFDSDPLTYDPVLFPAKYGPKVQILGLSLFHLAKLDHIWGSKSPKTSQKGLFHGC